MNAPLKKDGPSAFGRVVLPSRRMSENIDLHWGGRAWSITIGFDDSSFVREIFADGSKVGSEREAELDDACILISLLLQSGWLISEISARLSREATDRDAPAASILGLAVKVAAEAETHRREALARMRALETRGVPA